METKKRYKTFWSFYPYYLTAHSNSVNRSLHFVGTGIVITLFFLSIIEMDWRYFAFIPLVGYGFSWFGHFLFEKNEPAAFKYPLWSLTSDFVMFFHIITFQISKKMEQAQKEVGVS